MSEQGGGAVHFFANLPLFCATGVFSENLAEWCLQVVEKARDRERLKSIPQ